MEVLIGVAIAGVAVGLLIKTLLDNRKRANAPKDTRVGGGSEYPSDPTPRKPGDGPGIQPM